MAYTVLFRLIRHNQKYSGVIQAYGQTYSEPCVTLAYSEPWYIQKPGIATPAIFRTLAYLELCQTSRTAIIIFAKSNHLHNFSSSGTLLYEINIMNYFNSGQFILQKNLFYVK